MKRVLWFGAAILAVTGVLSMSLGAQKSPEELEKKYKEKIQSEFATKVAWKMTLEEAMAEARAKDSLILGFFTRSYSP